MFVPSIYKAQNVEEVTAFLKKHTFAALVSQVKGRYWATHIPLMLSVNENGEQVLLGHVSKANEQWKEIAEQEEVMAIFQGAHAYISSDWYDHENVSTWNYTAVHVYGKVKILEGEALRHAVKTLVDHYEPSLDSKARMENMNPHFLDREFKGIYGIELKINEIQAAFKLSQNRKDHDYHNVIAQLEEKNDPESKQMAEEMRKRRD
jgi:transcriptional regulator